MRILVTGAAGFIGSTTAEILVNQGHEVFALDNLSTGQISNVPKGSIFIHGDCGDSSLVTSLGFFDACIHFAGFIQPAESMISPEKYFSNNVATTISLVNGLIDSGTKKIIFSSSCAVYGDNSISPISESSIPSPTSPYGQSKLMIDEYLEWMSKAGKISSASLRYFNAAGGTDLHPENHVPEPHLIPIALEVASGRRDVLEIYGADYQTDDGTCVRDYIHVQDLAEAHILTISALDIHHRLILNLGTGVGSSIREVVKTIEKVTGIAMKTKVVDRRPGDPAIAFADNSLAKKTLGWSPKHSTLQMIIEDAWRCFKIGQE